MGGHEAKEWVIYGLVDPRSNELRYIGKSCVPHDRLTIHLKEARYAREARSANKVFRRHNWINSLLSAGVSPQLEILEHEAEGRGSWQAAERAWIKFFRDCGVDLVNGTDGGDGVTQSPEVRAKIRAANTGRHQTDEEKAKRSLANLGKPTWNKGLKHSEETKSKIRQSLIGKPRSEETRDRMRSAWQRRKVLKQQLRA
jgi:hypothetical protein